MVGVTGFGDEHFRESIKLNTRETMRRKAGRGESTGVVPFGYTSFCQGCGKATTPRRPCLCATITKTSINPDQAPIVVRIFQMAAEGASYRRITKIINHERIAGRAWRPTSIRFMLHNRLYQGVFVYGKTRNEDRGDDVVKVKADDTLEIPRPELRIVSDDLWLAVHDRLAKTRANYLRKENGTLWSRPEFGVERYLLAGLTVCGLCGGSMGVRNVTRKGKVYSYLCCTRHHLRGDDGCKNGLAFPMALVDRHIISAFKDEVLDEVTILGTIQRTIAKLNSGHLTVADQRKALSAEQAKLTGEIDVLFGHLASGLASVKDQIAKREDRLQAVMADLAKLDGMAQVTNLNLKGIEKLIRKEIQSWRDSLAGSVVQSRQILRKLCTERIVMMPSLSGPERETVDPFYTWEVVASYGQFLSGVVQKPAGPGPTPPHNRGKCRKR